MEKYPWAIGSVRTLTSPNAETTGEGGGMESEWSVWVCMCSGQCLSLSSDKQALCHKCVMCTPG